MAILSQQKQSQAQDFPNLRPSLDLRFALAKKLDPRITFTRGSTGTYFGPDGIMRTAIANEPRFDHDPVTGQSLGLLIEESRTNQLGRGDIEGTVGAQPTGMFLAGPTNGQTAVVSTDVFLGPNGQSCKHTRGIFSDNNIGYIPSGTVTAGSTYVFSAYVYIPSSQAKNFEGKLLRFSFESPNTGSTFASADVTIVDRWQRVFGTCVPSTTSATWVLRTTANAGSFFYTDCWQLELGSFPTSYMPASGGSQFTRSADLADMTGTNFSSWFNQNEGTIYTNNRIPYTPSSVALYFIIFGINAGNRHSIEQTSANGLVYITQNGSGVQYWSTSGSGILPANTNRKTTYAYNSSNNKTLLSGTSNQTSAFNVKSTTDVYKSMTTMYIGRFNNSLYFLNGTISRLTYYPIQLTNQQLINLTS
jgi:hypothetical protein